MSWECKLSIFVLFLLILEIFNVCASSSAPMCGNKAFTKVFSTGCKQTTEKKNASQVIREEPLSVAFVDLNDMLHFVLLWWFTEVKRIGDESSLFSLSLFIGCDWLWLFFEPFSKPESSMCHLTLCYVFRWSNIKLFMKLWMHLSLYRLC